MDQKTHECLQMMCINLLHQKEFSVLILPLEASFRALCQVQSGKFPKKKNNRYQEISLQEKKFEMGDRSSFVGWLKCVKRQLLGVVLSSFVYIPTIKQTTSLFFEVISIYEFWSTKPSHDHGCKQIADQVNTMFEFCVIIHL